VGHGGCGQERTLQATRAAIALKSVQHINFVSDLYGIHDAIGVAVIAFDNFVISPPLNYKVGSEIALSTKWAWCVPNT